MIKLIGSASAAAAAAVNAATSSALAASSTSHNASNSDLHPNIFVLAFFVGIIIAVTSAYVISLLVDRKTFDKEYLLENYAKKGFWVFMLDISIILFLLGMYHIAFFKWQLCFLPSVIYVVINSIIAIYYLGKN
jgi:hypothetical protein